MSLARSMNGKLHLWEEEYITIYAAPCYLLSSLNTTRSVLQSQKTLKHNPPIPNIPQIALSYALSVILNSPSVITALCSSTYRSSIPSCISAPHTIRHHLCPTINSRFSQNGLLSPLGLRRLRQYPPAPPRKSESSWLRSLHHACGARVLGLP